MCQPQGCVALRLLLDVNIPVQLNAVFSGHLVKSVNDSDLGWKNIKNGRLLLEMEGSFDLLVTADRNMFARQNLTGRNICILVLPVNRGNDVLALGERIAAVAAGMSAGTYVVLEKTGLLPTRSFNRSDNGSGDGAAGGDTR
jgi:predicted nuclease of predicted toxin-antitoxin system